MPKDAAPLEREVWLHDGPEEKAFYRAQRVAQDRGLSMPLVCYHPRCTNSPLGCTILRRESIPGGYRLVCEHKERVCYGTPKQIRRV